MRMLPCVAKEKRKPASTSPWRAVTLLCRHATPPRAPCIPAKTHFALHPPAHPLPTLYPAFMVSLLPEPRHLLPGFGATLALLLFYCFRFGHVGAQPGFVTALSAWEAGGWVHGWVVGGCFVGRRVRHHPGGSRNGTMRAVSARSGGGGWAYSPQHSGGGLGSEGRSRSAATRVGPRASPSTRVPRHPHSPRPRIYSSPAALALSYLTLFQSLRPSSNPSIPLQTSSRSGALGPWGMSSSAA